MSIGNSGLPDEVSTRSVGGTLLDPTRRRCRRNTRPNVSTNSSEHDGSAVPLLEVNSVNFVPHSQRYGKARSLFPLWFGATAMGVTLLTGSLAIITDLSLFWAAIAVALGTLVGTIFVAYHSAQGPTLGLPQMIQSRAQFGVFGANLPLVVVVAMYLGFFGGGAILAGQAVEALFGIPIQVGIGIATVASLVLVTFGYKLLHIVAKIITPIFIVVFAIVTIVLIVNFPAEAAARETAPGGFSVGGFFLLLGIVAAYFITYGPYVADYSRYLPAKTGIAPTFWYTYAGMAIAGIWIMVLGAGVQFAFSSLGIIGALAETASFGGPLLRFAALAVVLIGLINIGALNLYGAGMSVLTIVTSFMKHWKPTRALRLAFMLPLAILATIGAVAISGDFIIAYEYFIFFLITFLVPWSAINLVDFYFVRKGRYDVDDMYTPKGRYGAVSWPGMAAYLIGCAVLFPFISTLFYTGPLAAAIGFDVSWIVGLVVPGVLYLIFARIAGISEKEVSAAEASVNENVVVTSAEGV
jgi:NCS1 family nucleobase:cation symporter-1